MRIIDKSKNGTLHLVYSEPIKIKIIPKKIKVIDDVIDFLTLNLEELEYQEERVTGETKEGQADIKKIRGFIRGLKKIKENR